VIEFGKCDTSVWGLNIQGSGVSRAALSISGSQALSSSGDKGREGAAHNAGIDFPAQKPPLQP